jgi:hypothetical protein
MVIYASYLTNVGLLLMLLPWSEGWVRFVLIAPAGVAPYLDAPFVRGLVSAFGFLHLVLLLGELLNPPRPMSGDS